MGKAKRQRQKPHKKSPTGLPPVKDLEENKDIIDRSKKKALQNIYTEVQSHNLEEKLSALETLGSLACDSFMAKKIAKEGIAKIIGPSLVDQNAAIRTATACALRQIVHNGGEDAHNSLIQDDIMTPLNALLQEYYSDWDPKNDCKKKETKGERETFIQAVALLWMLCENNENVIKYANEKDLLVFLIQFLDINRYGIEITTLAAQCLISLSEDNETGIKRIKQYQLVLQELLDLKIDKGMTMYELLSLKSSISGLLINISNCADNNQIHILCKALLILSEVLAIDHKKLLNCLTSIIPHEKNATSKNNKIKVEENKMMLEVQQQALEILTNLCFDEVDNPFESNIDDSEIMEIDSECMNDVSADDNVEIILPVELVEVLNSSSLIDKIWDKTVAIDKDDRDILEQNEKGKDILKQIHTLRCRAYLCLNNLVSILEVDTLGGVDNIYKKWLEIGTLVFKDVNPDDIELLEAATAAMRAFLERLVKMRSTVFEKLTLNDIQPMLNGERQCSNANVRANLIKMLGNLALILMNNESSENQELIKHISVFLLDTCSMETQAWVIAESLDAIMDIYAEDETDGLAIDIHLISKLRDLIPHFKRKVQQQKKHIADNMSIISTVNANLMRFIKYKEKQIRNMK